ncbi:MAG: hypothetical protein P1V97_13840 [Planctomycetota bacterium]|nr:hypothetical protein [Planctomycetota bacterium]
MNGSLTVDELDALNLAFHLLARNLFTYSAEIGVFMAITETDKKILAVRAEALEEGNDLIDGLSSIIVATGSFPKVGPYKEEYTLWSFNSESYMLPEYLRETNEHRNKLIGVFETLKEDSENSPSDEISRMFKLAIASRGETLEKLNALAAGICDPVVIAEYDCSMGNDDDHGH